MPRKQTGALPATPAASAPGDTGSAGTANLASAQQDHRHAREAWGASGEIVANAFTAAAGASGKLADAAHVHPFAAALLAMQWMEVSP